MKQIAKENHPACRSALNQSVETIDGFKGRSGWNWNSACSKSRCLTPVWISDEQRVLSFPIRCALRQKRKRLTFQLDLDHPAARSSARCIRRILSVSFSEDTRSRVLSTRSGNASGGVRRGVVITTRDDASR